MRAGFRARDPYHARMDPNIDNEGAERGADERPVHEPRLWADNGWTAKVIKNEDDDGWAVAMTRDGEREPALVGPWTMGRDKKNPKPLDVNAFNTLVKTASEVIRRHEQAAARGDAQAVPGRAPTPAACWSRWTSCPTSSTRTRCWPRRTNSASSSRR